jgi:hypothetical protein
MPRVVFEPTIPVLEWAKTVHALDRAATMIGYECIKGKKVKFSLLQALEALRVVRG